MELIFIEHKKLWRKKSVKISVLYVLFIRLYLEAYYHSSGLVLEVQTIIQVLLGIILMATRS